MANGIWGNDLYSFLRSALHCFQNNSFVHCKSTKIVLTRKKKDSIFSPALIVGSSIKIEACAFGFIVIIILCLQISCGLQVWLLFWQSCQLWSALPLPNISTWCICIVRFLLRVSIISWLSVLYALNGRKVTVWILIRYEKVKI